MSGMSGGVKRGFGYVKTHSAIIGRSSDGLVRAAGAISVSKSDLKYYWLRVRIFEKSPQSTEYYMVRNGDGKIDESQVYRSAKLNCIDYHFASPLSPIRRFFDRRATDRIAKELMNAME